MKFYSLFNNLKTKSNSGSVCFIQDVESKKMIPVFGRRYTYSLEYDKKGKRNLVISGTEDFYNYIQSFKDDCDIYKILKRLNGDLTKLDTNKGFYADVSSIPKDISQWYNKIEQGKNIFNGLSIDLKNEFGNSLNEFMTSLYDKSFASRYQAWFDKNTKKVNVDSNVVLSGTNNLNNNKKEGDINE